jgi:hypothetical protein
MLIADLLSGMVGIEMNLLSIVARVVVVLSSFSSGHT